MLVPTVACPPSVLYASTVPCSVTRSSALRGWAARHVLRLHAVLALPAPAPWTLAPHGAASWHPSQSSTLTVTVGQAWVTLRNPVLHGGLAAHGHDSASRDSGDYFLCAGDSLRVAAGQHAVLEAADAQPTEGFVVPMPA